MQFLTCRISKKARNLDQRLVSWKKKSPWYISIYFATWGLLTWLFSRVWNEPESRIWPYSCDKPNPVTKLTRFRKMKSEPILVGCGEHLAEFELHPRFGPLWLQKGGGWAPKKIYQFLSRAGIPWKYFFSPCWVCYCVFVLFKIIFCCAPTLLIVKCLTSMLLKLLGVLVGLPGVSIRLLFFHFEMGQLVVQI